MGLGLTPPVELGAGKKRGAYLIGDQINGANPVGPERMVEHRRFDPRCSIGLQPLDRV